MPGKKIKWTRNAPGLYVSGDHRFEIERFEATEYVKSFWRLRDYELGTKVDLGSMGACKGIAEERIDG